jgi:autotransporter-associated beta strand protein
MVTNTVLYLTFDGGILKTGQAGEFFQSSDGSRIPNRVLVYEKGATIDTDGKDVTWRAPLARPEGKGLASVTINNATWTAANYAVGPSVIKVWNSGWFDNGGTAMVDFDNATRTQAAAAIVTCPGERYTEEDCMVKIDNRDLTASMITRTLRDLGSGSFTKRGAGTLTLTSTNSYTGATRLEGGTLAFTHPQGYPGSDLEIAAAAVQGTLTAPLLTANTLAFAAGKGVRVTEADTLDDKTFGSMKTVATFTTPLGSLPSLTLVDSDGDNMPPGGLWCLMLTDGGRTLKFGAMHGTMLIFK